MSPSGEKMSESLFEYLNGCFKNKETAVVSVHGMINHHFATEPQRVSQGSEVPVLPADQQAAAEHGRRCRH